MNNMLEEFVTVALEAFNDANGDIDKFELKLRRKLMTYTVALPQQPVPNTPAISTKLDNIVASVTPDNDIFKELENVDLNSLNDEQILALAEKMGLTSGDDVPVTQEDE